MKRVLLVSLAVLVLSGCAGMGGPGHHAPGGGIAGTWEHVSPDTPQYKHIKILTASHFVWVAYERETGMLVASGGGTYEFDGKTYRERLLFGSETLLLDLIGQDQVFRAQLDDDEWYHTGTLTNGMKVREVWKRLE